MADSFPAALWLIPLVLFVGLGVLFFLSRYLGGKAQADLKKLRGNMREFQAERKRLENMATSFSVNDPEPYRSRATSLLQSLAILRRRAEQMERRYVGLHQQVADLNHKRWSVILGAPRVLQAYTWHLLCRDIAGLNTDILQGSALLTQAARLESDIHNLSWEVSQQAREIFQHQQSVSQALNELQAYNLYGDTFESALQQGSQVEAAVAQIPRWYLEAEQASLLEQTTKENTSLVYDIVRLNRPRLDELLDQSLSWKSQYLLTRDNLGRMRQALDELGKTLSSLPDSLDATDERAKSRQYELIAQNLQATLSRLEVESMGLVSQEAERVMQAAQADNQRLRQAQNELASLEKLQSGLMTGFRDLSLQLATLGAKATHPVKWETSLEQLAQLNRQANTLINIREPRSPAVISADLASVAQISARQKELTRHCLEIGELHADLLLLLESPEFKQLPKWVRNTQVLMEKVNRYASENWPRQDAVESLSAELQTLTEGVQRLVIADTSEPVSELDLSTHLDETQLLAQVYRHMLGRVDNVQSRLEQLQQDEDQALERLEHLSKILTQIKLLVSSNPFLAGIAAQEIEHMLTSIQRLQNDLAQPKRGALVKKIRQVNDLANRVEGFVKRWLDQLGKEIQEITKELASSLAKLDAITKLEDASVSAAHRLLSSEQFSPSGAIEGRSRLHLEDVILELKRHSGYWQECTAAQKALENVHQFVESYEEATYQRRSTRELLSQASAWGGKKRSWPPTSATLEAEIKEMEMIEEQWQALKDRGGQAITLVAQFGGLSTRYQTLAERLRQSASRLAQEQSQVEDLETSIFELTSPWRDLLVEYRDNPDASLEIRDLVDSLDQEMKRIRREYIQGVLNYDQVLAALKALQRKARFYQVALDDDHALDSSGRVTRRRNTERR